MLESRRITSARIALTGSYHFSGMAVKKSLRWVVVQFDFNAASI